MAIELLDEKRQWGKIKAGFAGGDLYRNPQPTPTHPFKNGRDKLVDEAQMIMKPSLPTFGGGKKK